MNVNSPQQTPAIKDWLVSAKNQLSQVGIPSALLDSEIILCFVLKKGRTYLHSHAEEKLDKKIVDNANTLLSQRLKRVPIAYLVGYKEFYGREFIVTPATLIPRPESEDIINVLKKLLPSTANHLHPTQLIDIGTGSGCLGITAKLELPELSVTLIDISDEALTIAKQNAKKFNADITIIKNDLLSDYSKNANVIIANLPYVDIKWDRSPETWHEPELALFASDNGLSLIKKLLAQAASMLENNSYLIIESDPTQHESLTKYALKHSFKLMSINNYVVVYKLLDNIIGAIKHK